jgi:hypothetical protein
MATQVKISSENSIHFKNHFVPKNIKLNKIFFDVLDNNNQ